MNKNFAKLVAEVAKQGCVGELIQCGGTYETMPKDAIDIDWIHALQQVQTDVIEHLRFTSGDDGAYHLKAARRNLAKLVAVAVEMEKHLPNL